MNDLKYYFETPVSLHVCLAACVFFVVSSSMCNIRMVYEYWPCSEFWGGINSEDLILCPR